MDIFDFIAVFAAIIAVMIAIYSLKNGIGPVPTSFAVQRRVSCLLPDTVAREIVELGAGWGGMAITLARAYPKNKVVAVENCLPVWLLCWLRAKVLRVRNLSVQLQSIYKTDLSSAGLVYCYLYPGAMEKIKFRLLGMQADSVVISNTFSLQGVEEERSGTADDTWRSRIYLYRIPASTK